MKIHQYTISCKAHVYTHVVFTSYLKINNILLRRLLILNKHGDNNPIVFPSFEFRYRISDSYRCLRNKTERRIECHSRNMFLENYMHKIHHNPTIDIYLFKLFFPEKNHPTFKDTEINRFLCQCVYEIKSHIFL